MRPLVILLLLVLALHVRAANYWLTFTPAAADATNGVVQYIGWWYRTNQPASTAVQFDNVAVGNNAMIIPPTVPNGVYLTATSYANGASVSDWALPCLYDTNQFAVVTNIIPPYPAPTALGVSFH